MVKAQTLWSQCPCGFAPVGCIAVVDNVRSSQLLKSVDLVVRRRSGDNGSSSSDGELDGCETHTAGTLGKNPVTSPDCLGLQSIESIPSRQRSASQGASFNGAQGLRCLNKTVFRED